MKIILKILPFFWSVYFLAGVGANSVPINQMQSEAKQAYSVGKYQQARAIWLKLIQQPEVTTTIKADLYTLIAALERKIGNPGSAIAYWQKAIALYRQKQDRQHLYLLAAALVDRAQAHNTLAQTDFSIPLLQEANEIAEGENFTEIKAIGYQALGNAQIILGKYQQAIANYHTSLKAAKQLNDSQLIVVALNNLSNSHHQKYQQLINRAKSAEELGKIETENLFRQASLVALEARDYAQEAVEKSKSSQTLFSVEAKLQLVKLSKAYTAAGITEFVAAEDHLKLAHNILLSLPNSQPKARALIDLAKLQPNSLSILQSALQVAKSIGHLPTQSMALGYLGAYYEQKQNYNQALELTYQAQQTAEQALATELRYRWAWQVGRIYRTLERQKKAIAAYQQAIASLQLIRSDLATANPEIQIDFQLEVEPVYRQLLELLLTKNHSESEIRQALEVKDLLQLSELENFFGDDCIIVKTEKLGDDSADSIKEKTTIVNTIILEQKTYLILQLPHGRVKSFSIPISAQQINQMVEQWRYDLENQENESYLFLSQKLYQLLIKRIEPELIATETKQLVFVNDGILRNVPMAALHDGTEFLIEKYAVANSLGFDLKLNESKAAEVDILAFGLTSGSANAPPLPYIKQELFQLNKIIDSKNFLNQEFNINNFIKQTEKNEYNVIHIATHGEFSGSIQQTYLQAYNQKISLKELEEILNQRSQESKLELLTLSACDTAVGSKRAILGLAGVAIRSNVDNVLGSLWSVSDQEMVSLTSNFYHYWIADRYTKSAALRLTQIDLIRRPGSHPAIWSSLILINS